MPKATTEMGASASVDVLMVVQCVIPSLGVPRAGRAGWEAPVMWTWTSVPAAMSVETEGPVRTSWEATAAHVSWDMNGDLAHASVCTNLMLG